MAISQHTPVKQPVVWFEAPPPFFHGEHYHTAFSLRILSNHLLPQVNSTAFLLKDQNQFDLGISPFPDELATQYLLSLVFVDNALCIPFKTVI